MTSKLDKIKGAFFGSTETELKQFFTDLGQVTFGSDHLVFKNYPFDNSAVSANSQINSEGIVNICIKSIPPTIRIGNELIFVSAEHRQELSAFADRNKISLSD